MTNYLNVRGKKEFGSKYFASFVISNSHTSFLKKKFSYINSNS